jgi:hypothetical protein
VRKIETSFDLRIIRIGSPTGSFVDVPVDIAYVKLRLLAVSGVGDPRAVAAPEQEAGADSDDERQ